MSEQLDKVREELAELEHEQWIEWSKSLVDNENLSPSRVERWKKLWIPYSELTEEQKDQDRKWANKSLSNPSICVLAEDQSIKEANQKSVNSCCWSTQLEMLNDNWKKMIKEKE